MPVLKKAKMHQLDVFFGLSGGSHSQLKEL